MFAFRQYVQVRTLTSTYFYIIMSVGQVKKTSPKRYIVGLDSMVYRKITAI